MPEELPPLEVPNPYAADVYVEEKRYAIDYPYNVIIMLFLGMSLVLVFGGIFFRIDWQIRKMQENYQPPPPNISEILPSIRAVLLELDERDLAYEDKMLEAGASLLSGQVSYDYLLMHPELISDVRTSVAIARGDIQNYLQQSRDPKTYVRELLLKHRVPAGMWPAVYQLRAEILPKREKQFRPTLSAREEILKTMEVFLVFLYKVQRQYRLEDNQVIFIDAVAASGYNEQVGMLQQKISNANASQLTYNRFLDSLQSEYESFLNSFSLTGQ
jgi:hypothetical protein